MARVLVVLLVLAQCALTSPVAAQFTDADIAAQVAVELSALEASGDFNTLYDRIHPDARAEVPRAAAVGWFQNEFAPRGPGVSTVTGVRFVSWTWAVTGVTYPYTAEVSFLQPFADGTVTEDVVRLVQDQKGEWRWFFGRSREFVNEQITRYVPAVPVATRPQSIIEAVAADIDMYWAMAFATAGMAYISPSLELMDAGAYSACGYVDSGMGPGVYCPADQTVYISMDLFIAIDSQVGRFAWVSILAHEWGHHVQTMSGYVRGAGNTHELQADCLSGSYALDADTRGILEEGAILQAVAMSAIGGDATWMAQDQPGAHGTADNRISAFMRGYLDGFVGCQFTPASAGMALQSQAVGPTSPLEPDLVQLLPSSSQVPADMSHTGDHQRTLSDVVVNYTNPAETERLFRDWGWEGNVTRRYDGTGAYSGITSVYASIHRFSTDRNAALALHYSFQDQAASTGAWEVSVSPLAPTTRALTTASDITIYAQQGTVLIRLTASPATGRPAAEEIMRSMLAAFP